MNKDKTILRALAGERQETPPIWMMRQAGRYLPEYRATRAEAGDFLSLCYNSELAAEVTLQPIRRYGFDAAILFADILLLPQALGVDLWFETGEGPRMSTTTTADELAGLRATADIHETLNPIYDTVRILSRELPRETTLIGFAGAPWTVATYMIAGRGTKDQGPAHALKAENRAVFEGILERLTEATIEYLSKQIEAGEGYVGFAKATGADCIAIDNSVSAEWVAQNVQPDSCVQGNLASSHMVTGGDDLIQETKRIVNALKGGPHIFNLGHGITPDANPDNVQIMINTIRNC